MTNMYSGRVLVLLNPSLYRALKLISSVEVSGIVKEDQITTDIGTETFGQSIRVLTSSDFQLEYEGLERSG